jgi:hypothetical protein
MTPDYVLRRFPRKVGLRIGRGDERRVRRCGREGALGDAAFGAPQEGAKNRNEEVTAFPGEGIAEGGEGDAGWD